MDIITERFRTDCDSVERANSFRMMYILVHGMIRTGRSIHCSALGGDIGVSSSPVCDRVVQVEAHCH